MTEFCQNAQRVNFIKYKTIYSTIKGDYKYTAPTSKSCKIDANQGKYALKEGIYVIGFFLFVVPKRKARIRVQLMMVHEKSHLDKAIAAFAKVGQQLNVI